MKLKGRPSESCSVLCGATIGNLSYAHTCSGINGQWSLRTVYDSLDRVPYTTMQRSQRPTHTYQLGQNQIWKGETYNGPGCLTCQQTENHQLTAILEFMS